MRLAGGSGSLIRALQRDLPPERLCFGAKVTEMRLADARVELTVRHTDGHEEGVAPSQVTAAVPPRVFAATVRFEPAQEQETVSLWEDTPTWMAPHAKFFAIYDRPFWREAGTRAADAGATAEAHSWSDDRPAVVLMRCLR